MSAKPDPKDGAEKSDRKHTPGPLRIEGYFVVDASGRQLGSIDWKGDYGNQYFVGREEAEANGALWTAAPELLEACQAAREWLEGWASAEGYIEKLDAAIAKATGAA